MRAAVIGALGSVDRERWALLGVLFAGVLMGALDIAIVGPALPAIQEDFGVGGRGLSWVFNTYILVGLLSAPLMAKLSDRYGRRAIYLADVALFALGSLIVALAPSFAVLLGGRAVQALGAGGIFPVASAVIGDVFPPERRAPALRRHEALDQHHAAGPARRPEIGRLGRQQVAAGCNSRRPPFSRPRGSHRAAQPLDTTGRGPEVCSTISWVCPERHTRSEQTAANR